MTEDLLIFHDLEMMAEIFMKQLPLGGTTLRIKAIIIFFTTMEMEILENFLQFELWTMENFTLPSLHKTLKDWM